jgi:hypothetical protein
MRGLAILGLVVLGIAGVGSLFSSLPAWASPVARPSLPGFVVHFDFIGNEQEARELVRTAVHSGARVINVVPPAHVWENALALRMLDAILQEAAHRRLFVLFTRIDASFPPDAHGERFNYLYDRILTMRGYLPDGKPTWKYFRATVGREHYAEWMEEETRFYASHYGRLPNLLGINLGPFSEPFASERGGFLQYMQETDRYELTQYTPEGARVWHDWLRAHYHDVAGVNAEYLTSFAAIDDVPQPRSDADERFAARAPVAYFDLVRSIDDWFVERYERCRRIWHQESGRQDVPFILQFSGFVAEKLVAARPGAAAFDLVGWIQRADAVGLSLYTNNGYPDFGHASDIATVRLLESALDLGKDVFVLEGGCEAPNVVLNAAEMKFFGSAAAPLHPRVWIYEFLKDKFDEEYPDNPGKIVRADGRVRPAAQQAIGAVFHEIESRPGIDESPELRVVVDPLAARGDQRLGRAILALFDLAATMRVRWITAEAAGRGDTPCLRLDIPSADDELKQLVLAAPEPVPDDRLAWCNRVAASLERAP